MYQNSLSSVSSFIPGDRLYSDELRTLAWGTDAGEYRLIPKLVIRAADENEVSRILSEAATHKVPVTFRAAGTALSGQSITDSVLVVAGKNWEKFSYNESDCSVTLEPGLVGGRVNRLLARRGACSRKGVPIRKLLIL